MAAKRNCKKELVSAFALASGGASYVITGLRRTDAIASMLGVTQQEVERLCVAGLLKGQCRTHGFGESLWLVDDKELLRFLRDNGKEWFDARLRRISDTLETMVERRNS